MFVVAETQRAQSGHVLTSTSGWISVGSAVAYAFDTCAITNRTKSSAPRWFFGNFTARSDAAVVVEVVVVGVVGGLDVEVVVPCQVDVDAGGAVDPVHPDSSTDPATNTAATAWVSPRRSGLP